VERCKALEKALEDFALAERSIADGEATYDGYLQMAGAVRSFVADEARVLTDELARRLQSGQKIQVSMEAMLIESLGRSTPVHLDGYDRIQVGDPRPFQRIRLAVDERTQKELAAAEKLGSTLQKLKSGEYQRELRATLERLRTSLASLREGLRAVELEKHLSALLVDLRALADDDLAPLLARVRDLRDRVLLLARVPELPGDSGAAQLAALSRILDGIARDLTKELETLPATLRTLADEVENVFRQHGREARAEILTFLRDAQARLEQDLSGLKALYDELKELARAFGLLEDTATDLERVERIPRDVTPGSALDTFFDLETIRDREPRPGDALALIVRVVRTLGEREETVGYGRQSFRLVSYRWYLEPNGALFFIDPRDSIPRDLDFEPSVGLGLHWKIDLRGFGLWNDILRPGFGVSFTLLDFDDDKGFELGVAGSLTLFRDILWVGYGRDLQAEADYFYLGVNPLVLGGLWRQ
jgi:ElaB/YqjD/DUF883 family membrane-anchored ribosome-binding protein